MENGLLEGGKTIRKDPLGSSVPGILQAKILEWIAIAFSVVVSSKLNNR